MFGIFEAPHLSWSGGAGGGPGVFAGPGGPSGGGPGGFPGIFPGGGVSNSGWAGLNQVQQEQLKKDCVKNGTCVIGPPASMMGRRF
jgi:hypothetical protein